ncbi:hypothetical protein SLA2020_048380 [Shorea laevis]
MGGNARINCRIMSLLRFRTVEKRTIIVGLKSDYCSRQMLLQVLSMVVRPGDDVLAVHVQEMDDEFDPNTFHIHEDLCKSKQVDLLVKVCTGDSYISGLSNQVRVNHATILAIGCNHSGLKGSVISSFLKELPPTCTLLVMENAGRILFQRQGTSQQGCAGATLQVSLSSSSKCSRIDQSVNPRHLHKSLTIPSFSPSPSASRIDTRGHCILKKPLQVPEHQFKKSLTMPSTSSTSSSPSTQQKQETVHVQVQDFCTSKLFQRIALLEAEKSTRHFTLQELSFATNNFNPAMVIGEGGHSVVYRANLEDGQKAAVKVLKPTHFSREDLVQEVEMVSSSKHDNIVKIIGFCANKEFLAIVYNLLKGNLKQHLKQLNWNERMGVAIGVAKALEYLHHVCDFLIIHRDVKPSNILLSDKCHPQLSDFGGAILHSHSSQVSANKKPVNIVGALGYLAPEYMMYGKVDEKIDVYSYGVLLLQLITGKEVVQRKQTNHENLVLWARSLLCYGVLDRLVDPYLSKNYKKEEMEIMIFIARLCLLHSSSRRPTMKTILRFFEDSECWVKMQGEKDQLQNRLYSKGEKELWRQYQSACNGTGTANMDDIKVREDS